MAQHFLLSARAQTLSLATVLRMTDRSWAARSVLDADHPDERTITQPGKQTSFLM